MFNNKNFNIESILPKDNILKICKHNKPWVLLGTLKVKRNGFGDAIKVVKEKCSLCNKTREKEVRFTDTRVQHEL